MAVIHQTTMSPGKLELLAGWLPGQPWYVGTGRAPDLVRAGGFRLDDPQGEVGIEFMAVTDRSGEDATTYHVPMTYRGTALDELGAYLIGTAEHGVLGPRWIYDGVADPVLLAQLVALVRGEARAQAQSVSHTPDTTVECTPLSGERDVAVRISRVLSPAGGPAAAGEVSATWLLGDGVQARGTFATAWVR